MKEKKLKLLIALIIASTIGLLSIQFYWIYSIVNLEKERINNNLIDAVNLTLSDIEKYETEKQVIKVITSKKGGNNFVFQTKRLTDTVLKKDKISEKVNKINKTKIDIKIDRNFDFIHDKKNVLIVNNDTIINLNSKSKQLDSLVNDKKKIIDKVFENVFVFNYDIKFEDRIPFNAVDSIIKTNLNKKGIFNEYCFGIINNINDSVIFKTQNCNKADLLKTKIKQPVFSNPFNINTNYLHVFIKDDFLFFIKKIGFMLGFSILFLVVIVFVFYKTLKSYFLQKKISELKTDLINNVTHEFKTPIASINLAGEMLKSFNIDEQTKYINIIDEENNRLRTMVENLLNASKLEHSEIKPKIETVNILEKINSIVQKYKVLLEKLNGKIIITFNNDKIYLNTDLFCLNNIINNLIDNSIKYNLLPPEIKIDVIEENLNITIKISDNGYGIEKKYLNDIFEPFFRVPKGNVYKGKGHGLGLSYVKKSVEILKGQIIVESSINKGTTFTIILPKL